MGGKAKQKGGGKGMSASRHPRSGDTEVERRKLSSKPDKSASSLRGRGRLSLVLAFVLAFILAFFLAWLLFRNDSPRTDAQPPRPPEPRTTAPFADPTAVPAGNAPGRDGGVTPAAPARTISRAELEPLLAAAGADDFASLEKIGGELFAVGNIVPDHKEVFSRYRVDGPPPYVIYAFMSGVVDGHVVRVMLTVDEAGAVVSYMAEKMRVVD